MSGKCLWSCLMVMVALGWSWIPCAHSASMKKLMIAVNQEPASLEPILTQSGADFVVVENWGEYLIQKTPSGELKPGLATSWKVSPDGKTVEFALRKGVKFHSGDPLTVSDVKFSFERGQAKNNTVKTRLGLVEKFEVIDDYRFKLYFKTPDVTYISNRGGVMIASKIYYDRVGEEQFVRQPVGTGPYKFVQNVPGEYVDIERFEDYWGQKPSVREARFYFVPEDTTRLAKLQAKEVDLIQSVPYPLVKQIEQRTDLKVVKLATNHPTQGVIFANSNPKVPWHDRRVRLAMAYAIDCDAITKKIAYGIPQRLAYLAPGELGYDPNLKPYPYDPKKAKALLAEAGYPNGFEFKIYWPITGRSQMSREIAEAVGAYLEVVGLRPQLVGEEYAAYYARRRGAKAPDAEYVVCGTTGRAGAPDPSYYLDLFYSSQGGQSVYSNPEFDKVVAQAKATVDNAKRAELIKKAVRIGYDDVAGIPIFSPVFVYAMQKNVDFKPTQKNAQDLVLVKDITLR